MAPQSQPELKKYLEKRVEVQLNGTRKVTGQLRGYDVFLNIVLDTAVEVKPDGTSERMGMCVIRGNSVVAIEALEAIGGPRQMNQPGFRGPPMGGGGGGPPSYGGLPPMAGFGGPPPGAPPGM